MRRRSLGAVEACATRRGTSPSSTAQHIGADSVQLIATFLNDEQRSIHRPDGRTDRAEVGSRQAQPGGGVAFRRVDAERHHDVLRVERRHCIEPGRQVLEEAVTGRAQRQREVEVRAGTGARRRVREHVRRTRDSSGQGPCGC